MYPLTVLPFSFSFENLTYPSVIHFHPMYEAFLKLNLCVLLFLKIPIIIVDALISHDLILNVLKWELSPTALFRS